MDSNTCANRISVFAFKIWVNFAYLAQFVYSNTFTGRISLFAFNVTVNFAYLV